MKIYVKCNSHNGYLYIFKHGTGPGTIPKDVVFLREKDLPNGYTAVWLDRFLRTNELKAYDIPSETEINRYLDRIGYCQKDGDVVPCDDVEACDKVTASKTNKSEILDKYVGKDIWVKVKISEKAYFRRGYTNDQYWIRILDKDGESYIVNKVSSYKEYKGNKTQKSVSQTKTYTVSKDSITISKPIETATTDEIFGDIEAYGDINASQKIKASHMWDEEDFDWEDYGDPDSYGGFASPEDFENWYQNLGPKSEGKDIEGCGDIEASDTKYFANMVNASQDKMLYPVSCKYYVAGYLNGFGKGLMEDFCSDDFSAVLDKAHEMASEGLYITMWFEAIDLGDVPNDVYDITSSTEVKAANWPDFDKIRDAERFLGTVAPDKIALVEKCRNKLLELYAYRDVQDAEYPDIETTIGSRESEIIRDYKSEAAEEWEDYTVEEADELFDDIMRALDDINADEAAAWT